MVAMVHAIMTTNLMSTICTTLMIRLDNWDVDELDNDIDNEDDLMQPVSEPASVPVPVSCVCACVRACLGGSDSGAQQNIKCNKR